MASTARILVVDDEESVALTLQGLFDRFYQVHAGAHNGGLDLGLYLGRPIVELPGGSLDLELPDEGGMRFVVRLPTNPVASGTPVPSNDPTRELREQRPADAPDG